MVLLADIRPYKLFGLHLISRRLRHYWKNMGVLEPPDNVRGMTELQRQAFAKSVRIPKIRILETEANKVIPLIKTYLLKMEQLKNVNVIKTEANLCREVLLHPTPVLDWDSLPTDELGKYKVTKDDFYFEEIELTYNNWRADEIFKKVLPEPENAVSSFSRIGHIVHVNLKDCLLPYKKLIGEVLLDKVPGCRTVVNKITNIDNTYRNFQMELLAGIDDYKVETRENKIFYEFDFSKVYWNPRLSTEHARVTQLLKTNDVLYDIFAGVGPFSVPAAIKKCFVYANDLNPDSFNWLRHNLKRNKSLAQAKLYNKDGRDFIRDVIRPDLINRWRLLERKPSYHIHITMNLPAMAVEFLDTFRGLLEGQRDIIHFDTGYVNYPIVHVYYFARGKTPEENREVCLQAVQESLGIKLYTSLKSIEFVRNVALCKDMYRISFVLNKKILTTQKAPDGIIEIDEEQEIEEQLRKEEEEKRKRNKANAAAANADGNHLVVDGEAQKEANPENAARDVDMAEDHMAVEKINEANLEDANIEAKNDGSMAAEGVEEQKPEVKEKDESLEMDVDKAAASPLAKEEPKDEVDSATISAVEEENNKQQAQQIKEKVEEKNEEKAKAKGEEEDKEKVSEDEEGKKEKPDDKADEKVEPKPKPTEAEQAPKKRSASFNEDKDDDNKDAPAACEEDAEGPSPKIAKTASHTN